MQDILKMPPPRILVIGDIILDKYIWGSCERISPEAPVPVVKACKEELRLGGGANVYANLKALNAKVEILSVIGDDLNKDFLNSCLKGKLFLKKGYKTPVKTRVIASNQQVLRLDDEEVLDFEENSLIKEEFLKIYEGFDAIVLSDYAKGLLGCELTQFFIKKANEAKKPVLIDPKGVDYSKYKGATLLTPNKKEAQEAGFLKGDLKTSLINMQEKLGLKYPLITLSEEGIAYLEDEVFVIPAKAKEVFDVTGAGDSVIATLAYALALKFPIKKACELANAAAAVVVSRIGSAQASLNDLKNQEKKAFENKIKTVEELKNLKDEFKNIVFTNGCFDILHFGHLSYLESAKKLGDVLVVGLNSDESVRRLKGPTRPINSQAHRSAMLAGLSFVDFVVIFHEDTPYEIIKKIKPNILVKGADYKGEKVVGEDLVDKLVLIDLEEGLSTSNIIRRIHENR